MTRPAPSEALMRRALAEAEKGRGRTRPNPNVGAIIARGDTIIATGFTAPAGGPHAEARAIAAAGEAARGADIYVTLEPCNHFGRTPPCSEAIIKAGIARVITGVVDPNPDVRGGGIGRLRQIRRKDDVFWVMHTCSDFRTISGGSQYDRTDM